MDPYTIKAFETRTNKKCRAFSFEDIVQGKISDSKYSLVVCSYAMHLASEDILPILCVQLALISKQLIIITPHKRPEIQKDWGWDLKDEIVIDRTRAKYYLSTMYQDEDEGDDNVDKKALDSQRS